MLDLLETNAFVAIAPQLTTASLLVNVVVTMKGESTIGCTITAYSAETIVRVEAN